MWDGPKWQNVTLIVGRREYFIFVYGLLATGPILTLFFLFVTQVLLSQCHRFRALVLLGRFLDMGPWAVELVSSMDLLFVILLMNQYLTVVLHILCCVYNCRPYLSEYFLMF